jgi:hypothetical protein
VAAAAETVAAEGLIAAVAAVTTVAAAGAAAVAALTAAVAAGGTEGLTVAELRAALTLATGNGPFNAAFIHKAVNYSR